MASGDADRWYETRAVEAGLLIQALQDALAKHKVDQSKAPRNWGFAGDLAEINHRLREAVTFLGGDPDVADHAHGMSDSVTAEAISPGDGDG